MLNTVDNRLLSTFGYSGYTEECNNVDGFRHSLRGCTGQESCYLPYDSNWFVENCTKNYIEGTSEIQKHKLFIKLHCYHPDGEKQYITLHSLNFLVILVVLTFIMCWSMAEKRFFEQHAIKYPKPSDYTIELRNLPDGRSREELQAQLCMHLMKYEPKLNVLDGSIINILVPIAEDKLSNLIKRTQKKEEVSKILDDLHGFGIFKEVTIHNISSQLISDTEEKERKEINKEYPCWKRTWWFLQKLVCVASGPKNLIKELKKDLDKRIELKEYIAKSEEKENVRFNSAFVTFSTMYAKNQYYKAINISYMYRLCCFICFRKCNKKADRHIMSFEKLNLEARKPSDPVNILWTNLHITDASRRLRGIVSFILTILIVLVPVVLVIIASTLLLNQNYLDAACPKEKNLHLNADFMKDVVQDYERPDSQNLIGCLCFKNYFTYRN